MDIIPGKQENREDSSDYGGQAGTTSKRSVRSRERLWENAEMTFKANADLDGESCNQELNILVKIAI